MPELLPATRECPFPDCEWTDDYDPDSEGSVITSEFEAEHHYEREHAGRVEIQVTLERTQLLGTRETKDIRKRYLDETDFTGWDVASVRTRVLKEADDHSVLAENGGASS
jgi:hypothetical protein